jgi:hypothetical protein
MLRNLKDVLRELKEKQHEHPPREYYTLPKAPENGNTSTTCGSSWSGEKFSGRSQSGGRDR